MRAADAVIASSEAVAQQVVGAVPRVVYAGVPVSDESPRQSSVGAETIIGTACRLVPIKGIPNLVRAFRILHAEFPEVRLEIAGDGPERQSLADLVAELGLSKRVIFLGWKPDLPSVLVNWDIFVLSSWEESFPVAVVEAMAAGLPVVASAVGGLPEVVRDGEAGRLVPAGDPRLLADCLRELLMHPEQRTQMGIQGKARVRENFSEEEMVRKISQIYDELIRTRGRLFDSV